MPQQINEKTFQIIVKKTKTYQIIVSGFTKTSLWFISIFQSLIVVAIAKLSIKMTSSISLDPLRLDVGTMFLTSKITSTLSSSLILSALASLKYKVLADISNSAVIDYVLKLTNKISSTLNTSQNIVFTIITAVLFTLGDWDVDTLGTMDVQTLGDLDYTAV